MAETRRYGKIMEIQKNAMNKEKVMTSLKEHKLTVREASELLGVEYWEMQQIIEEEGVHLVDINKEEIVKRQKNKF